MNYSNRDRIPADLEGIQARLRQERATAAPLELDRIKLRAMQQADRPRPSLYTRQKGKLMKSRLALTIVIATGMLMSMGGATMAITGSSGSGSAAKHQYPQPKQDDKSGAILATANTGDSVPSQDDQVAVASTDPGSLPFSGFAAIPLLVLGLGLLSAGLVLRFKASKDG